MKINGWQRLGIIASVGWILVAGIYALNRLEDKTFETGAFFYRECSSIRDETYENHSTACERRSEKAPMIDMSTVFSECMVPYEKEREEKDHECTKRNLDYVMSAISGDRFEAAVIAFVPVPLAWGGAYLALFLFRWVRRGWSHKPSRDG